MEAGVSCQIEKYGFYGTVIARGRGEGIVTATGIVTEIGKIAESLRYIKEDVTPLQKRLAVFSKWLLLIVVFVSVIIFLGGILGDLILLKYF